jgi:hypothetical protein
MSTIASSLYRAVTMASITPDHPESTAFYTLDAGKKAAKWTYSSENNTHSRSIRIGAGKNRMRASIAEVYEQKGEVLARLLLRVNESSTRMANMGGFKTRMEAMDWCDTMLRNSRVLV